MAPPRFPTLSSDVLLHVCARWLGDLAPDELSDEESWALLLSCRAALDLPWKASRRLVQAAFGGRTGIVRGAGVVEPRRPHALAVGVLPGAVATSSGSFVLLDDAVDVHLVAPRAGETYVLVLRPGERRAAPTGAGEVGLVLVGRAELLFKALPVEEDEVELCRVHILPGDEPKLEVCTRVGGSRVDLSYRVLLDDSLERGLAAVRGRVETLARALAGHPTCGAEASRVGATALRLGGRLGALGRHLSLLADLRAGARAQASSAPAQEGAPLRPVASASSPPRPTSPAQTPSRPVRQRIPLRAQR